MVPKFQSFFKISLCSAEEKNSYRVATTWGWVSDDRIFIFGWSIPLKLCNRYKFAYAHIHFALAERAIQMLFWLAVFLLLFFFYLFFYFVRSCSSVASGVYRQIACRCNLIAIKSTYNQHTNIITSKNYQEFCLGCL